MDDATHGRFTVLSREHSPPCLEELERKFVKEWVRIKQNLAPSIQKGQLGYRQEKKAKDLAADAYNRRLRKSGLMHLPKDARAPVIALSRAGATLLGPSSEDDVYELAAGLHAESPWMRDVSAWVMKQLLTHVAAGGRGLALPPVIIAGPPGTGKSHFARHLATLAGLPSRIIDVGAGSAGFRIVGTERGWGSAQAGVPVETILSSHVANPVMIVDEVDKAGTVYGTRGTATSLTTSLLPLLDPDTARRFECPYNRLRFDLARVVWIMTANDPDLIPAPLRDRARVFHVSALTAIDAVRHFDKLTASCDEESGLTNCRIFISRTAEGPRGISLRKIRQLADACKAPIMPTGH